MSFQIKNKVALVTGGASGIGLAIVKQLLNNGAKGVVIADINSENGKKVEKDLENEYGQNKAIFIQTDVSDSASFENAFQITLNRFNNIDILINNAGVAYEGQWEKVLDVNMKGVINGIHLGLEKYLRHHNQDSEAVILNTSSLAALMPAVPVFPIYSATKAGVLSLTKNYGDPLHFNRTKVRVIAICPGMTDTPILEDLNKYMINSEYADSLPALFAELRPHQQSADSVAKEAIRVLEKAPNGTIWIVDQSEPAYQYKMQDVADFKNNTLE